MGHMPDLRDVAPSIAKDELGAWPIECYPMPDHDAVFYVKDVCGKEWFLKAHQPRRGRQLARSHEILRAGFDPSGDIVAAQECKCVGWAGGVEWSWEESAPGTVLKNTELLKNDAGRIGKAVKRLHDLTIEYPLQSLYSLAQVQGDARKTLLVRIEEDRNFLQVEGETVSETGNKIFSRLDALLKECHDDEGLLHGDLAQDNLSWDGDRLWAWDLIDLGYGWIWYDIGNLLCDEIWKEETDSKSFLKGYLGKLPNEEETKMMVLGVATARFIQAGSHARNKTPDDWVSAQERLNDSDEALEYFGDL